MHAEFKNGSTGEIMENKNTNPPKAKTKKRKRKYWMINNINPETGEVSKWYTVSDSHLAAEEDKLRANGKSIGKMFRIY